MSSSPLLIRSRKYSRPHVSVNHAELTVIFATPEHIASLLKLAPKAPVLKMIVSMEPLSPDTKSALSAWGETVNVQIKEIAECTFQMLMYEFRTKRTGDVCSGGVWPCQPH